MIFVYRTTREDVTTVYADAETDIEELEEWCNDKGIMPGSVCVVAASGSRYMMDSARKWHKIT